MKEKKVEEIIKQTKELYNLIAEDFNRTRAFNWPEIEFLIGKYTKEGSRVLDLGCGNGRLLDFFQKQKVHYLGLDNSESLIRIARKRYQDLSLKEGSFKFIIGDALNQPFLENTFDLVVSLALLHHIPSQDKRNKFFQEVKRVLKPKGILILTVWNLWQNPRALKLLFKYTFLKILGKSDLDFFDIFYPWKNSKGEVVGQRYLHFFRKKELKDLAERNKLKVLETGILPRGKKYSNIYLVGLKEKK